jgi:predicted component of type VI protein secretion system
MIEVGRPWLIGRSPRCDWVIDDRYVSPVHASVWRDGDGAVWIADGSSTNGTRIRRGGFVFRVHETVAQRLHPGDVVLIGRTVIPWTVRE